MDRVGDGARLARPEGPAGFPAGSSSEGAEPAGAERCGHGAELGVRLGTQRQELRTPRCA